MPTYEYECTDCEYVFEKFQSIKDKPLSRCPKCRHKLKRLFGSGAGIIFKGSGFYETDYRRKGSASSDKPAGEGTSSASGSSSETKTKSND